MHKALTGIAILGLLAGCSGNTYGTGVSSQKQLYDDVASTLSLGSGEKKNINYDSRPKLVKPPMVAELPAPAEKIQAESAYFPEDPEIKRAKLLAELEENGGERVRTQELTPELEALRKESLERSRERKLMSNNDGDCRVCDHNERMKIDNEREAKRTAEIKQPTIPTRKYLTQPPTEYHLPSEEAPVGELGEEETANNGVPKKKKKSLLDKIFGG